MTQTTVAVCGVHGSGKSCIMGKLEKHYKSHGNSVYVVNEVARDCARKFPLGTLQLQRKIWYEHWRREMEAAKSGVDIVLCDRSVMDNLVYLRDILNQTPSILGENVFNFFYPIATLHIQKYTHVVRLPLNEEYITNADDDLRPRDLEYARRIDDLFTDMVQPYVTCTIDELFL